MCVAGKTYLTQQCYPHLSVQKLGSEQASNLAKVSQLTGVEDLNSAALLMVVKEEVLSTPALTPECSVST